MMNRQTGRPTVYRGGIRFVPQEMPAEVLPEQALCVVHIYGED